MKKQIQTCLPAGRKLSLNKKTISNLSESEMSRQIGGTYYYTEMRCASQYCTWTCHGKTCNRRCFA